MPDTEITLAAARAAASAERCASSRARYSVITSIDRAAIAIMAVMATATRIMVMPRSRRRPGHASRNLRITGGFILSILIHRDGRGRDRAWQSGGPTQKTRDS